MNTLKSIWYMARRFKTATALNLAGLTVAFAAFYLLMTQVDYAHSYNRSLKDHQRMYRIEWMSDAESPWMTWGCRPLIAAIGQLPQVEDWCDMSAWAGEIHLSKDGQAMPFRYDFISKHGLDFFGAQPVDGQTTWETGDTGGLVLPASVALALLGTERAAGRYVCSGSDSIVVRGVYRDLPQNTLLGNPVLACLGDENMHNLQEWSYFASLKLHEGVDADEFRQMLMPTVVRALCDAKGNDWGQMSDDERRQATSDISAAVHVRMRPYDDTYYSNVDANRDKGNRALTSVLLWAAVLMIVVAAINFLNFTLAESPMRIKGVNTRRVLGESRASLVLSMVGDAVVTAVAALALAIALCALVAHVTTPLLMGSLSLSDHPLTVATMAALAIAVGVAAGAYPAFYSTSFPPAMVLKGNFGLSPTGRRLRTLLVAVQLTASMVMVCYIGILYMQSHYIYHADYGYDKDQLFYIYLRTPDAMSKKATIRSELEKTAGVTGVAFSQMVLGSQDQYMGWGRSDNDHVVNFQCFMVDHDYLDLMGIRVTEGRGFTEHDSTGYVINPAARARWTWVEMDRPLLAGDLPVVGVCEEVRFASMRRNCRETPFAFILLRQDIMDYNFGDRLSVVNIRTAPGTDKAAMRRQLQAVVDDVVGNNDTEVRFLDQRIEQLYREEFRFMRQVLVFSLICLVITLIGVFCLTMFETEYRRKEIGLRKIMGASTPQVLLMLCRRYAWLLGTSFVVAVPLAWFMGHRWLQSFAEHTPIAWWLFALSLALVSAITLATVVAQSWRTANDNPVDSIKSE